jgi:hypothetical protein
VCRVGRETLRRGEPSLEASVLFGGMCRITFLSVVRKGRGSVEASASERRSPEAKPLARVWAGVKPGAGAWGRR